MKEKELIKVRVFPLKKGSAMFSKDYSKEIEDTINNHNIIIEEDESAKYFLKDYQIVHIEDSHYIILRYVGTL